MVPGTVAVRQTDVSSGCGAPLGDQQAAHSDQVGISHRGDGFGGDAAQDVGGGSRGPEAYSAAGSCATCCARVGRSGRLATAAGVKPIRCRLDPGQATK